MKAKSLVILLVTLTLLVNGVVISTPAKADNVQEMYHTFLPIVLKNPDGPIWVLNPVLPEPNGYPGYSGQQYTFQIYRHLYINKITTMYFYFILKGAYATVPPVGEVGDPNGCYAVILTEDWEWSSSDPIILGYDHATEVWMKVADFSAADPLAWAAQLKEDLQNEYGGKSCDIALYYKP